MIILEAMSALVILDLKEVDSTVKVSYAIIQKFKGARLFATNLPFVTFALIIYTIQIMSWAL